MQEVFKPLAASVSSIAMMGSGIGIGLVFGSYILASALNPRMSDQLFGFAILGFALTESIALFSLMMSFVLMYS